MNYFIGEPATSFPVYKNKPDGSKELIAWVSNLGSAEMMVTYLNSFKPTNHHFRINEDELTDEEIIDSIISGKNNEEVEKAVGKLIGDYERRGLGGI